MKTNVLAVVPALLSVVSLAAATGGLGFIGFQEGTGQTTTVTSTTSSTTVVVYYSTIVTTVTGYEESSGISVGPEGSSTYLEPYASSTYETTIVTTVPDPSASTHTNTMSTSTSTATATASVTKTSTAGAAATLGVSGLVGLAAGVIALI